MTWKSIAKWSECLQMQMTRMRWRWTTVPFPPITFSSYPVPLSVLWSKSIVLWPVKQIEGGAIPGKYKINLQDDFIPVIPPYLSYICYDFEAFPFPLPFPFDCSLFAFLAFPAGFLFFTIIALFSRLSSSSSSSSSPWSSSGPSKSEEPLPRDLEIGAFNT